jgi:putative flippase GtrA
VAISLTPTQRQFVRYATIGLVSNLALYLIYILLTNDLLQPHAAMTIMYAVGVLCTFVFNRNWTFAYLGTGWAPLMRYILVYAFGYVINFLMLSILVDKFGYPHELVQGGLILFLAGLIFLAQKLWVFDSRARQ